jgi:hypothetical protein
MPSHQIDHVRIACSRGIVEIPWDSRNALIDKIRQLDLATPTIDTFENVGVSQPIVLTHQQKIELIELIELWGDEVIGEGGLRDGLPEGIFDLRNKLIDDLHDAQEWPG